MDFVYAIIQLSIRAKWEKGYTIYWQGDIAESFFFIFEGSIKLMAPNGQTFKRYFAGETVGESDSLLGE